ncbi:hypothetical protein [Falsiruegeria mediterranea]
MAHFLFLILFCGPFLEDIMNTIEISNADVDAFLDTLDLSGSESMQESFGAAALGVDFCSAWPVVKTVLETIAAQVGFPANLAIKTVITIGDGIHARKCG